MRSIRRHLLRWLLGALSLGSVLLALATYAVTLQQMNEVFDGQLKQVALTVSLHHGPDPRPARGRPAAPGELAVFTQVWTDDGGRLFVSVAGPEIPFMREAGFRTVQTRDGPWRVYTTRPGAAAVQAAQPLAARRALAAEVAFRVLLPSLAAVPLIALALAWALGRGLRPLAQAAREVGRRSATLLEAIEARALPVELHALVESINALLARLNAALSAQRRFTADAAHELRTPLAALRLQLRQLQQAADDAERAAALSDMRGGLDRATRLVEQMLALSRLEPDAAALRSARVDAAGLARTVVGEFSPRADARGLDLGAEAPQPVWLQGDPEQLRVLLNNLVDNAVRYTPTGGRIDVRVLPDAAAGTVTLEVRDDGPGIAEPERARVFDRFYRGRSARPADGDIPGTGLGLAIVRTIAERHGATVELADGLPGPEGRPGLAVRVRFPEAR